MLETKHNVCYIYLKHSDGAFCREWCRAGCGACDRLHVLTVWLLCVPGLRCMRRSRRTRRAAPWTMLVPTDSLGTFAAPAAPLHGPCSSQRTLWEPCQQCYDLGCGNRSPIKLVGGPSRPRHGHNVLSGRGCRQQWGGGWGDVFRWNVPDRSVTPLYL